MSEHDDLGDIRLRPENTALLMPGHQTGIMAGAADIEPNLFRSNVLAPAHGRGLAKTMVSHLPFYGMLAANLQAAKEG